jgi:hypothetical protein
MRYDGILLTGAESLALINEVDRWCRRTGTNYNKLVVTAGVAPGIRHMVRIKGKRISAAVAARLRQSMRDHRKGITREDYRQIAKPWRREAEAIIATISQPIRMAQETCRRCGAREGMCEHTRGFESGRPSFRMSA